jgi:hypothetical protein
MHRQVHVRKTRTAVQRGKSAAVIFAESANPEAAAVPPIPGMKTITRSERKPANRSPPAEAKPEANSKSEAAAEAKE